ncbi:hypothetical protein CsSME_00017118 [Camellia sinensis var. sinensis]
MYALMMNTCCTDHWSLGHTPVSGGEGICIGDGHMALLHVSTYSLIVSDHCVVLLIDT